jgi:hypothetical protein
MRRSYILETTDTFSHDSMHANDLRANHLCQTQAVCKPGKPAPLDASPAYQTCHGLVRDHAAHWKCVRFTLAAWPVGSTATR